MFHPSTDSYGYGEAVSLTAPPTPKRVKKAQQRKDEVQMYLHSHAATVVSDLCAPRYHKGQTLYLRPNSQGPIAGREYLFIYRAAPPETVGEAATPIIGTLDGVGADTWSLSRWQGGPTMSLPKKLWYPTYRTVGAYCGRLTRKDEFFADPQPRPEWASRRGVPVCHYEAMSNDMAPRWEKGSLILVKHEPPKELDDYVLLEMRSGALVVRLLGAMTEKTLTVTKHNPPETATIRRSEMKAMHRVIGLEEALYSGAL
jgi:hypothetical protein